MQLFRIRDLIMHIVTCITHKQTYIYQVQNKLYQSDNVHNNSYDFCCCSFCSQWCFVNIRIDRLADTARTYQQFGIEEKLNYTNVKIHLNAIIRISCYHTVRTSFFCDDKGIYATRPSPICSLLVTPCTSRSTAIIAVWFNNTLTLSNEELIMYLLFIFLS